MTTLTKEDKLVFAKSVRFTKYRMFIRLSDGREIGVPLEWFPALRNAPREKLKNWRFIGRGIGIRWKELDEDILVEAILKPNLVFSPVLR